MNQPVAFSHASDEGPRGSGFLADLRVAVVPWLVARVLVVVLSHGGAAERCQHRGEEENRA